MRASPWLLTFGRAVFVSTHLISYGCGGSEFQSTPAGSGGSSAGTAGSAGSGGSGGLGGDDGGAVDSSSTTSTGTTGTGGAGGTGGAAGGAGASASGGASGSSGSSGSSGASGAAGRAGASGSGVDSGNGLDVQILIDALADSNGATDTRRDAGCPDVFGSYKIAMNGTCGDLNGQAPQAIRGTTEACSLHFTSVVDSGAAGVNGGASLNSDGKFSSATLYLGTAMRSPCSGSWDAQKVTMTVVCGSSGNACTLELLRVGP